MKKQVNRLLKLFGYRVINVSFREKLNQTQLQMQQEQGNTMKAALNRLQASG